VRLDWHKRGQLTLTHRDANGHSATMQVPVEIHGNPPVIAFNVGKAVHNPIFESLSFLAFSIVPSLPQHRHHSWLYCRLRHFFPLSETMP
jgi:hypothetical protein